MMRSTFIDETKNEDKYAIFDEAQEKVAVSILDTFTKTFCRRFDDYERFGDMKFRCSECPFQHDKETETGVCAVKEFKEKYYKDYIGFGSIGG